VLAVWVGEEGFDFGAEADAAVSVGLIADVDDAGAAIGVFLRLAGEVRRHAEHGFDGHANLKRGGSGEIEATARDIQNFREMFGFVRG
jgi:hypothetical protein